MPLDLVLMFLDGLFLLELHGATTKQVSEP
jgi:hypothetical protein